MTTVVERRPISSRNAVAEEEKKTSFVVDERLDGDSESLVLECDCKAKLVLGNRVVALLLCHDRFDHDWFVCRGCGQGFIITGIVSHRYYSWMEDQRERLEGKEAREAYYARI